MVSRSEQVRICMAKIQLALDCEVPETRKAIAAIKTLHNRLTKRKNSRSTEVINKLTPVADKRFGWTSRTLEWMARENIVYLQDLMAFPLDRLITSRNYEAVVLGLHKNKLNFGDTLPDKPKKAIKRDVNSLYWTSELPTKVGWYWVTNHAGNVDIRYISVKKEMEGCILFAGPIKLPLA